MSNVIAFPNLIVRAKMSLMSHLRTVTDEATLAPLRMALLYVNTALDAEAVHDRPACIENLKHATAYLHVASEAHKMHLVHPLTAITQTA